MSSPSVALEIHVHLQDGKVVRFAQSSPEAARSVLAHVQPNRFFTQHHFIINGDQAMTAFQSSAVVRIDFVTDSPPVWAFHYGATDVQEISEGEFRERYRPEPSAGRAAMPRTPDGKIVVFTEFEMVNGERVFTEVHFQPDPDAEYVALDQGIFIQQLFATGGLNARRRGGGVVIINPANIVRLALYPGLPEAPAGAWSAHRLRD